MKVPLKTERVQVITVFLGTIIGGSLFTQFNQWVGSLPAMICSWCT